MIERSLYRAAQALPTPRTSFYEIENIANDCKKKKSFRIQRYRMATALVVCAILLMGGAAVAATTEANYSAWARRSNAFRDVDRIANELGIVLPKSLDDRPFCNVTTMYVATEGTTYLQALTNPAYPWYSVVYDGYSISVGSTNNELFRYVFSLDESEIRILENAIPGSYRTEAYNGITMQIVTDVQYDEENDSEIFAYHHRVIWVDANNHAVFSLHKSFYADEDSPSQFPNEMVDFTKEIIDMNR